MSATELYRKQHDELVELVETIAGTLDESALANGVAAEVCALLNKLAGKLMVHLAAEDHALYPRMIASDDREAAAAARKCRDEMGGLKEAFQAYYAKWNSAEKIGSDPVRFIAETQGVFEVLGERVRMENTVLYPLADRL